MEKFKFLEHTADIKFQAFGSELNEAFINSALALTNIICKDKIKPKKNKKIKIKARKRDLLLYDFFLREYLTFLPLRTVLHAY